MYRGTESKPPQQLQRRRRTLSDADFSDSIAGYHGPGRKTTSVWKTTGVLDPKAFDNSVPLLEVGHEPKMSSRSEHSSFYRPSYLRGFTEATDCEKFVIEFTPDGPKVFTMTKEGPKEIRPENLPRNLFVLVNDKLAKLYDGDPVLSGRICSFLSLSDYRTHAEFIRTTDGLVKDYPSFFFAVVNPVEFDPVTRLSLPSLSVTFLPGLSTARRLNLEGKIVFSSPDPFVMDHEMTLYCGYDQHDRSFYLVEGSKASRIDRLTFMISLNGRIYIN